MNQKQLSDTGGFVAGTLVHTDNGLVPIQELKVGDRVLSKPESGEGDLVYSRVLKTKKSPDKHPIMTPLQGIYCTKNHPFWVRKFNHYTGEFHEAEWLAAEHIAYEDVVYSLKHGYDVDMYYRYDCNVIPTIDENALVTDPYEIGGLYLIATDDPHVALYLDGYDDDRGVSDTRIGLLDFSTGEPVEIFTNDSSRILYAGCRATYLPSNPIRAFKLLDKDNPAHRAEIDRYSKLYALFSFPYATDISGGRDLEPGEEGYREHSTAYTDYVYNIEVEDTHTYFVGQDGVWVHNAGN